MLLPTDAELRYPIFAIADLHGHRARLDQLLTRLARRREWATATVAFLGDYVDRGPDTPGVIAAILALAADRPVAAVLGNHDMALARAAGLDTTDRHPEWVAAYRDRYPPEATFRAYIGRPPRRDPAAWVADLDRLRAAIPAPHARFLATRPWVARAAGHAFLHNGLSPDLDQEPEAQLQLLAARRWPGPARPRPGTPTAALWQHYYPVWLGADRRLSATPLPCPGVVQVTGHVRVAAPEADPTRIRLDTTGGDGGPLTACLLRGPAAPPVFITPARRTTPARRLALA